MNDLDKIPATKADFFVLFALLGALAEKLTGERPTVYNPECLLPVPLTPAPGDVTWRRHSGA